MNLDTLNPAQREAVEKTEGPVLILAGAGSGKTRVLTTRIGHLIEDKGVQPANILAITFTNKAANEMRERVEETLESDASDMWISTFHSCCVRILRKDINRIGYNRSFVIYDSADQVTLVKDCLKELNLNASTGFGPWGRTVFPQPGTSSLLQPDAACNIPPHGGQPLQGLHLRLQAPLPPLPLDLSAL